MKKIAIATAAAIYLSAPSAHAGAMAGGATMPLQITQDMSILKVYDEHVKTVSALAKQYITLENQYTKMIQNLNILDSDDDYLKQYARKQMLEFAQEKVRELKEAAQHASNVMTTDRAAMQELSITPGEYYSAIAEAAAQDNEWAQEQMEDTLDSYSKLAERYEDVEKLRTTNRACDGNVKCLQGLAEANAQMSALLIDLNGGIKQMIAYTQREHVGESKRIQNAAEDAAAYGEARKIEADALRRGFAYTPPTTAPAAK